MRQLLLILALIASLPAAAQQSDSYRLTEQTLNAGGNPSGGVELSSTSFAITLDALGDGVVAHGLAATSYLLDVSFVSAFRPPVEVQGLLFTDPVTLVWSPEMPMGVYNLYRDQMTNLASLGYGACLQFDLTEETATDSDPVPADDGFFYLVTAENSLDEEGSKGTDSEGSERPNPLPCP